MSQLAVSEGRWQAGPVKEITFVEPFAETGGCVARWDNPAGGGIATQGDSLAELDSMIADAVAGYFEPQAALAINRQPIPPCGRGSRS